MAIPVSDTVKRVDKLGIIIGTEIVMRFGWRKHHKCFDIKL